MPLNMGSVFSFPNVADSNHVPFRFKADVLTLSHLQIDAVLVEELLEAVRVDDGEADADDRLELGAVVPVLVRAVHRPVAQRHDPGDLAEGMDDCCQK